AGGDGGNGCTPVLREIARPQGTRVLHPAADSHDALALLAFTDAPRETRPPVASGLRHADVGHAGADEAKLLRSTLRQVYHAPLDEGATVVDAHDHRLAVLLVGDLELGAKRKSAMRSRQFGG